MSDEALRLDELVAVTEADVYKQGRVAGRLVRARDDVVFRYDVSWRPSDEPVATTLPVRTEPVRTVSGSVPSFFAGQLPEGRRLSALRRATKTSPDDELTLLLGVGDDVVGDVQVVPAGAKPGTVDPLITIDDPGAVRFAALIGALDAPVDRVGIPGIQSKASAAMINLPVKASGSHFILKIDPPEFPHLVENEAFFLDAARRSGLSTVEASMIQDADGAPGLLVRRFDRTVLDGVPRRLAVEDGCQVLDRHPAAKYTLSSEESLGGLSRVCGAPVVAGREFLRQLVFAFLTGNGDAHAKNFSVVQGLDGEWRPAPAYDLPSSQPYGDSTLAMSIGGRRDAGLPAGSFVALGLTLGVPERATRKVVGSLVESADLWLTDVDQLPFSATTIRKFRRVVDQRRHTLERG